MATQQKCMTSRIDYLRTSLLLNGLILAPLSSCFDSVFYQSVLIQFCSIKYFFHGRPSGPSCTRVFSRAAMSNGMPSGPSSQSPVRALMSAWQGPVFEAQQTGSQCHRGLCLGGTCAFLSCTPPLTGLFADFSFHKDKGGKKTTGTRIKLHAVSIRKSGSFFLR